MRKINLICILFLMAVSTYAQRYKLPTDTLQKYQTNALQIGIDLNTYLRASIEYQLSRGVPVTSTGTTTTTGNWMQQDSATKYFSNSATTGSVFKGLGNRSLFKNSSGVSWFDDGSGNTGWLEDIYGRVSRQDSLTSLGNYIRTSLSDIKTGNVTNNVALSDTLISNTTSMTSLVAAVNTFYSQHPSRHIIYVSYTNATVGATLTYWAVIRYKD